MKNRLSILLILLFAASILFACEQPPGEFTGMVKFADGRPASVIVKVFDSSGRAITETASTSDGVFYTGKVIPTGSYTIKCFRADEEVGASETLQMESDGSVAVEIVVK